MSMPPMPPGGGPPSYPQDPPPLPGTPPPNSSHRRSWIVLGAVLVVVVAMAVGLVVWKSTSSRGSGATGQSEAGVDRTVGVLRERDPVCDEWLNYADELSQAAEQWTALNRGVPATKWTPEHREIYVAVGEAMTTAADQFESILPKARNVLLQELIAQTIVYLRAYVERIPEYVESDSLIAGVAAKFSNAVTDMCEIQPQLRASSSTEKTTRSSVPEPAALTPFMADKDRTWEAMGADLTMARHAPKIHLATAIDRNGRSTIVGAALVSTPGFGEFGSLVGMESS